MLLETERIKQNIGGRAHRPEVQRCIKDSKWFYNRSLREWETAFFNTLAQGINYVFLVDQLILNH
jgi:hypothetical protein